MNDTVQQARVRWHCRRGMLELDVVLHQFFDHFFQQLSVSDQMLFEQLLECTDQDLFNWLMKNQLPDPEFRQLVDKIRNLVPCHHPHN